MAIGELHTTYAYRTPADAKAAWEQAEKSAAKAIPTDKRLAEIRKKLESLDKLTPTLKPASGDSP